MNLKHELNCGGLTGVCTDLCAFFDTQAFLENLKYLPALGVNIISAAFQCPNPSREYYKKSRDPTRADHAHALSAINADGSLAPDMLAKLDLIIKTCDKLGLAVLVNILDPSCEHIFKDEFAVITGLMNALDALGARRHANILVNLTNISHTFYKSSLLNGGRLVSLLASLKARDGSGLTLGAGLKHFSGVSFREYTQNSDFIPLYSVNFKSHSTKKMLESIYFFKPRSETPLIMAKGDDLSPAYGSYGKNSLAEAREHGVSYFYYNLEKLGLAPVDWGFLRALNL